MAEHRFSGLLPSSPTCAWSWAAAAAHSCERRSNSAFKASDLACSAHARKPYSPSLQVSIRSFSVEMVESLFMVFLSQCIDAHRTHGRRHPFAAVDVPEKVGTVVAWRLGKRGPAMSQLSLRSDTRQTQTLTPRLQQ